METLETADVSEEAKFIFDLPRELRQRARIRALEQNTNLSQVLRDFLEAWTSDSAEQCPCQRQTEGAAA